MIEFKRNQLEEGISRLWEGPSEGPSGDLRMKMKRLLATDRGETEKARKKGQAATNYAFHSADKPGKGEDIHFSAYEALALDTGLRLLEHGWPQSFVVRALRHIRSDFEGNHTRILRQDPAILFDRAKIKANAERGVIGVKNTDPTFLAVVTGKAVYGNSIDDKTTIGICRGSAKVSEMLEANNAHSWSLFELVNRAHDLAKHLSNVRPRTRGRG